MQPKTRKLNEEKMLRTKLPCTRAVGNFSWYLLRHHSSSMSYGCRQKSLHQLAQSTAFEETGNMFVKFIGRRCPKFEGVLFVQMLDNRPSVQWWLHERARRSHGLYFAEKLGRKREMFTGPCADSNEQRFLAYFDYELNLCSLFMGDLRYCLAGDNRFETRDQCRRACISPGNGKVFSHGYHKNSHTHNHYFLVFTSNLTLIT